VNNLFACSLCIFGSPSLAFLYGIEKDGCYFAKPPSLEIYAGWNPKPLITAKGIG